MKNLKWQKADWGIRLFSFPGLSLSMDCVVQQALLTSQEVASFQVSQKPCVSSDSFPPALQGASGGSHLLQRQTVSTLPIRTAPFDTGLTTGLMSVVADSPAHLRNLPEPEPKGYNPPLLITCTQPVPCTVYRAISLLIPLSTVCLSRAFQLINYFVDILSVVASSDHYQEHVFGSCYVT